MIRFEIKNQILAPLPTDLVLFKLDESLKRREVRNQLKQMKFDHRFTKPIDVTGDVIAEILLMTNTIVKLDLYTQNWFSYKYAPVNAHVPNEDRLKINVNSRMLNRRNMVGPKSWEETLFHELVHVADGISPLRFDHGDNKLKGKDEAAPIKFARFMAGLSL